MTHYTPRYSAYELSTRDTAKRLREVAGLVVYLVVTT